MKNISWKKLEQAFNDAKSRGENVEIRMVNPATGLVRETTDVKTAVKAYGTFRAEKYEKLEVMVVEHEGKKTKEAYKVEIVGV